MYIYISSLRSKFFEDLFKDSSSDSVEVFCPDIPEKVLTSVLRLLYIGDCQVSKDIVNDVISTLSMFGINSEGLLTKTDDCSQSENFTNNHLSPKENLSSEIIITKTEQNEEHILEDDFIEDDNDLDNNLEEENSPVTLNIKKYDARLECAVDLKSDEEVRRAIKNLGNPQRGPKPMDRGPLVCEICAKEYTDKKRLTQHIKRAHPEALSEKSCDFCTFSTNKPTLMKEHILDEHKDKCQNCNYCSAHFASTKELLNHNAKFHDKGYYECNLCNTIFKQIIPFQEHQADIHNIKVKCDTCDYGARSNITLKLHKKRAHKNLRNHICNICGSSFNFEHELATHNKNSHEKVRIKCELCDHPGFIKKSLVKEHILAVHAGIKYSCDYCDRSFGRKIYLNYHLKHSNSKTCKRKK